MSDFVYPAYFEAFHKPGSMQFDWMYEVTRPFEIKPGGYQQLYRRGRWTNHTVALRTKRRLAAEDRRYRRSELRKRPGVRRRSDRGSGVVERAEGLVGSMTAVRGERPHAYQRPLRDAEIRGNAAFTG